MVTTGDDQQKPSPQKRTASPIDVEPSESLKRSKRSDTPVPAQTDANQSNPATSSSTTEEKGFVKIVRIFVSNILFCVKLFIKFSDMYNLILINFIAI